MPKPSTAGKRAIRIMLSGFVRFDLGPRADALFPARRAIFYFFSNPEIFFFYTEAFDGMRGGLQIMSFFLRKFVTPGFGLG